MEKRRRIRENPLKYARKHKKQEEASDSTRSLRVLFWANRTGKSEWGGMEAAAVVLGEHPFIPPGDGWSFCPSFDEQKDTTQEKILRYIPAHRIVDKTWLRKGILKEISVKTGDRTYKITFKSYEQGREKAQGAGKRFVWFDEEPPKDIFDECSVRSEAGEPLYLWMTMTPIKGMCFDDETRLMSPKGWVGIDELEEGDEIYTVNQKTLAVELKPVDFIYRGWADKPMIEMKAQGFDSLTTHDHRWFVKNGNKEEYQVRRTDELKSHHVIPRAVPSSFEPRQVVFEDWYVSLLGWVFTDGTYSRRNSKVLVVQSLTKNARKCTEIERLLKLSKSDVLTREFAYHKGESCEGIARHYSIKGNLAKRIMAEFPDKVPTPQFITALSGIQRLLFFDAMIGGDGSRNANGVRFVAEDKYRGNAEGMMMLCQLMGLRCTMRLEKGKYWRLHIQTSSRFKPWTHVSSLKRKRVDYGGRVWCPHTENETVIAMRNGTSYVSMNTWVYNDLYLNTANKDLFVSTATWDDNPFLTEEQKRKMAGRLTAQALKVRREGKFMRQVGLVASWFDRTVHVMDMDEVPEGQMYFGVDFGFSNPCAGLWVSLDNNENVWVYDGFYKTGMTNPDVLKEITLREANTGLQRKIERIADSAQASDIKELNDAGCRIQGVEKESGTKHENWDEYRAKLMEDLGRISEDQPHPRILISSSLTAYDDEGNPYNFLVRELENLRWEEVKNDGIIQPKSVWGKQANHAVDSLTYILATIERNRKRGMGGIVKAVGSKALIDTQIIPDSKSIIEAMKKANQRPKDVWQDSQSD